LFITAEGKWLDTILFEIYILSIVNELYFKATTRFENIQEEAHYRLTQKIEMIKLYPQLKISEFGTRRRYSKAWQEYVLIRLIKEVPNNIVGTSNVYLAMKLGIKAHGTMAHEFISAHLALVENISEAQKRAFFSWLQEYDKDLGTALTDTFTTKAFFNDFGVVLSNGFSGMRHDSGDPFVFARNCIAHYKKMGIDPRTKFLIFSDGLTIRKAVEIWKAFAGEIGLAFGIGTHLTNDMAELISPLNIVMKLIWCNGKECVKIGDGKGKGIGGENGMMLEVKKAFKVEET
jgi:nicotinate phosphoribosyltransferase